MGFVDMKKNTLKWQKKWVWIMKKKTRFCVIRQIQNIWKLILNIYIIPEKKKGWIFGGLIGSREAIAR